MATTEIDIKDFMQEHKLQIPNNDKFMSNLMRQIDLLPVPASLEKGRISEKERRQLLSLIIKELKRENLRSVSGIMSIVILLWAAICILLWTFYPEAFLFLKSNGIPMADAVIFSLASAAFIFPTIYLFRTTELL